jgi:glycosyltransferase involved in cell wall biosynthesis
MILLLGLWLLAALYEGALYWQIRESTYPKSPVWSFSIAFAAVADVAVALSLVLLNWRVGGLALLLMSYRLINLARFYVWRLPLNQLRTVSLRAHVWVALVQLLAITIFWMVEKFHIGLMLVAIGVVLQLLVAVMLLRVSFHTWIHTKFTEPGEYKADKDLPSLSVLIPARNETDALEACLQNLVTSDYPKFEILVLDDCSTTRRTPEIIRAFAQSGVRFIQGGIPDETRWLAKNQAYDHLAQEASGELLLFAGVDVVFSPHSVRELVQLMLAKQKEMISVLPLRAEAAQASASLLQPMRYWWELCLPRRIFKRPPVLSSCWLITKELIEKAGSFKAVARSVTPEAHFARQAVVGDGYSFIRGDAQLGVYSTKPVNEQYATTVRMRYPQLHRRLELVMLTALFQLTAILAPIAGLVGAVWKANLQYSLIWAATCLCIGLTYYLVAVETKLNNAFFAWLLMPFAFLLDIYMLHVSCLKYEFSSVDWKGRNVCIPVMQVQNHLPHST